MIVRVIPPPGVVPRDWLTTQLPDVPRIGETVDIDGEQFTVAAVRWLIETAAPDSALIPEVGLERIDDLGESDITAAGIKTSIDHLRRTFEIPTKGTRSNG